MDCSDGRDALRLLRSKLLDCLAPRRDALLENANAVAVEQVRALLGRLPVGGAPPVFVFDAGYDAVALALGLADTGATVLVRMRGDRCYYADVPPQPGKNGRPRKHGRKFACYD